MGITQLYQPKGSNLCGQTCVAMACGISIDKAIEVVGKRSVTTGPDLAKALRKLGVKASPRMIRKRVPRKQINFELLPKRCIAKVRSHKVSASHWVLVWDEKIYDPYPGRIPWKYFSGYLVLSGGVKP